MLPTAETIQRIQTLRAKSLSPEGLTKEELAEAIIFLRQNRMTAAVSNETKTKSGGKSKKPTQSADEMLGELGL